MNSGMNMSHLEKMFQMTAMEQMFHMIQTMKQQIEPEPEPKPDIKKTVVKIEETDEKVVGFPDFEGFKEFVKTKFDETNDRISILSLQMNNIMTTLKQLSLNSENIQLRIVEKNKQDDIDTETDDETEEDDETESMIHSFELKSCITDIVDLTDDNSALTEEERYTAISTSKTISSKLVEIADILNNIDHPQIESDTSQEMDDLVSQTIKMSLYNQEESELVKNADLEQEEPDDVVEEEEQEDVVEEEQEDVVEEEPDDVEEEEQDEVFEVEIDDVTYFATDEENGILYSVDKNGDIGDRVGVLKDGEPIFDTSI